MIIERLKERLNLSADQKAALDRIVAESPGNGRGGGGSGGSSGRGALMEKVRTLLDDSQRAILDEMVASRGGRGRQASTEQGTTGRLYQLGPTGEPTGVTVRLGASDGAFTEVLSGLAPGAVVIVGGGPAQPRAASGFRFGL